MLVAEADGTADAVAYVTVDGGGRDVAGSLALRWARPDGQRDVPLGAIDLFTEDGTETKTGALQVPLLWCRCCGGDAVIVAAAVVVAAAAVIVAAAAVVAARSSAARNDPAAAGILLSTFLK